MSWLHLRVSLSASVSFRHAATPKLAELIRLKQFGTPNAFRKSQISLVKWGVCSSQMEDTQFS